MAKQNFSRTVDVTKAHVMSEGNEIGVVEFYGQVTLKEIDSKVKELHGQAVTYSLESETGLYELPLETFMQHATKVEPKAKEEKGDK